MSEMNDKNRFTGRYENKERIYEKKEKPYGYTIGPEAGNRVDNLALDLNQAIEYLIALGFQSDIYMKDKQGCLWIIKKVEILP